MTYVKNIDKNRNGAGRKSSFKSEYIELAHKFALLGAKNTKIAELLGVSEPTLTYWKHQHPEFDEAIIKGREIADAEVAYALYERAKGYSHPDVQIIANRVKTTRIDLDTNEKVIEERTEPLLVPTVKHYPPSEIAAKYWLSVRQKNTWTESHKVEIGGNVQINHFQHMNLDPKTISDDELKLALKLGVNKALTQTDNDPTLN